MSEAKPFQRTNDSVFACALYSKTIHAAFPYSSLSTVFAGSTDDSKEAIFMRFSGGNVIVEGGCLEPLFEAFCRQRCAEIRVGGDSESLHVTAIHIDMTEAEKMPASE